MTAATLIRCDCGSLAVGISWRWLACGVKSEVPLCATCRADILAVERNRGYHERDDGWRWTLLEREGGPS